MLTWRSGFQTVGPACAKALRVPCFRRPRVAGRKRERRHGTDGGAQDKNLVLFCSDHGAHRVTEMVRGRQRVQDM